MDNIKHEEWVRAEIKRNMDFVEAIDKRGRYFMLTSEYSHDVDYYLDDFISDDEFNALVKQLKTYLLGNIEHWQKYLEGKKNEETDNIS